MSKQNVRKAIFESRINQAVDTISNTNDINDMLNRAYQLKLRGVNVSEYFNSQKYAFLESFDKAVKKADLAVFCESITARQRIVGKAIKEEESQNRPPMKLTRRSGSGSSDIKQAPPKSVNPTRRSGSGSKDMVDYGSKQKKLDEIASYVKSAFIQQIEPMFKKFVSELKHGRESSEFKNTYQVAHYLKDKLISGIENWKPQVAVDAANTYQGYKKSLDELNKPQTPSVTKNSKKTKKSGLFGSMAKQLSSMMGKKK